MDSSGIIPTLNVGANDGYGFGGSGIWLFAILALMWGGFGGNRYGADSVATKDDLNFSRMESQVRANAELTERKADAISNGICSLGYEIANKFGETNTLIMAENQKTRDLLQANKIESLQAQVNKLQLEQAMCGVVRYPNNFVYTAGNSPFCGCNGYNI